MMPLAIFNLHDNTSHIQALAIFRLYQIILLLHIIKLSKLVLFIFKLQSIVQLHMTTVNKQIW